MPGQENTERKKINFSWWNCNLYPQNFDLKIILNFSGKLINSNGYTAIASSVDTTPQFLHSNQFNNNCYANTNKFTTLLRNSSSGHTNGGYQSLKGNTLPLTGLNNNNSLQKNGNIGNGIGLNGGETIIRAKNIESNKEFKEWYVWAQRKVCLNYWLKVFIQYSFRCVSGVFAKN